MRIFHGARRRSLAWDAGVRAALMAGSVMCLIAAASSARAQTITACVNKKNGAVSLISKGTCNTKTTTSVVLNPTALQTLAVQTLNVVDANNHTVATLGKSASGNQLTFFDSSGKQTLTVGNGAGELTAGLEAWDDNNVIPETRAGVVRTFLGETQGTDPLLGQAFSGSQGFGGEVYDASSLRRLEFGLNNTANDSYFTAIHSNGTSATIGALQSQSFAGYVVNDLNGIPRQSGGVTLDGTVNLWEEVDSNVKVRVLAQQSAETNTANGFFLLDQNELPEAEMAASPDGSEAAFDLLDTNQIQRFSAAFTSSSGANVDVRDGSGNITAHLP